MIEIIHLKSINKINNILCHIYNIKIKILEMVVVNYFDLYYLIIIIIYKIYFVFIIILKNYLY